MANESNKLSEQIVDFIKFNGPSTATQLAKHFGVTPMGIRQHLHIHMQNGLLCYVEQAAERGRPKRLWQLSLKAQQRYPDKHPEILIALVNQLSKTTGKQALHMLLRQTFWGRFDTLGCQLSKLPKPPLIDLLLRTLRGGLESNGYCCNYAKAGEQQFYWYEFHCPILSISQCCPEVDRLERDKMQHILGKDFHIQTLSHLLDGHYRTEQYISYRGKTCN